MSYEEEDRLLFYSGTCTGQKKKKVQIIMNRDTNMLSQRYAVLQHEC
jgi:hypothetical protein